MGAANTVQGRFRYRNDNGTETGATWKEIVDDDWVPVTGDLDTPFRLRFEISTTGMDESAGTYDIYLSVDDGTYAPITTSSTNGVISVESGWSSPPADNSATTELMAGTGTFVEGQFDTTGSTTNITITNGGDCEIEYCLQLDSSVLGAGGQKLEFQVYRAGAVLDAYTVTPTIASAPAAPVAASDSTLAYIKGKDATSDSQIAYVKGGIAATPSSKSAYIEGTICPVVDIQSGQGSIKTCAGLNSYGNAIANTSLEDVVETLLKFTFDNNTAQGILRVFVRGTEDWDDGWTPTRAYEALVNSDGGYTINRIATASRTQIGTGAWAQDTNAWWIRFRADGTHIRFKLWADSGSEPTAWDEDIDDSASGFADAGVLQLALQTSTAGAEHTVLLDSISYHSPVETDSKSAYVEGASAGTPASSRALAYIAGSLDVVDSKSSYISGSINVADNQASYIAGTDAAADNVSAYVAGTDAASDRQPAYIAGTLAASDSQAAYIEGVAAGTDVDDSQPAYVAGTASIASGQAAYIEGLGYFPFTDDFSVGSNDDPLRADYWGTSTV